MKYDKFSKIESIKEIKRYSLPHPETIFVFDLRKEEKKVDKFLKGKKIVSIRSDKRGQPQFCPNIPRCRSSKAKSLIRKINKQGYAVILHEYLHVKKGRIAAGHILILKNHILMELISFGPVSRLDRQGVVEEIIKFRKDDLTEVEHFGRKLAEKGVFKKIAKLVKNIPCFKILDFVLMERGVYFYQIQNDKTSKKLRD